MLGEGSRGRFEKELGRAGGALDYPEEVRLEVEEESTLEREKGRLAAVDSEEELDSYAVAARGFRRRDSIDPIDVVASVVAICQAQAIDADRGWVPLAQGRRRDHSGRGAWDWVGLDLLLPKG